MPEHPSIGDQAHSPDLAVEETDVNIEIVEEGEEAETIGPAPSGTEGRLDLSSATYLIGRSCMTDDDLNEYVKRGAWAHKGFASRLMPHSRPGGSAQARAL